MDKKNNYIPIGNLYQINQQLVNKEVPLSKKQINLKQASLVSYFNEKYYMLLCRELNDYTVYKVNKSLNSKEKAAYEVIETLKERGTIYAIDAKEDGAYEIWIKPFLEELPHAYYLFPYTRAVIEC